MNYRTRKVQPDEVNELHEILRECGLDMKSRLGLGYWDPPYPLPMMRRDAEEGNVYAVLDSEKIVATFTVGTEAPPYYNMTIWEAPKAEAMYVSRLAVLPWLQGSGIGVWCMETIERLTAESGCKAVRLDAHGENTELLEFYRRLGYSRRGDVTFQRAVLACFEKVIEK